MPPRRIKGEPTQQRRVLPWCLDKVPQSSTLCGDPHMTSLALADQYPNYTSEHNENGVAILTDLCSQVTYDQNIASG